MTAVDIGRRAAGSSTRTRRPAIASRSHSVFAACDRCGSRACQAAPVARTKSPAQATTAAAGPSPMTTSRPNAPGPAIHETFSTPVARAFAAGSWWSGTHSGVAAARAGYDAVAATAVTAASATRISTDQPTARPPASTTATTERMAHAHATTALRDHRSATTPAIPEKRMYGANPRATVTESHGPEEVRTSTSSPTARVSTSWATVPAAWAKTRSRKLGDRSAARNVGATTVGWLLVIGTSPPAGRSR